MAMSYVCMSEIPIHSIMFIEEDDVLCTCANACYPRATAKIWDSNIILLLCTLLGNSSCIKSCVSSSISFEGQEIIIFCVLWGGCCRFPYWFPIPTNPFSRPHLFTPANYHLELQFTSFLHPLPLLKYSIIPCSRCVVEYHLIAEPCKCKV